MEKCCFRERNWRWNWWRVIRKQGRNYFGINVILHKGFKKSDDSIIKIKETKDFCTSTGTEAKGLAYVIMRILHGANRNPNTVYPCQRMDDFIWRAVGQLKDCKLIIKWEVSQASLQVGRIKWERNGKSLSLWNSLSIHHKLYKPPFQY